MWHDYSVWSWQFWAQIGLFMLLARFFEAKWTELISAIKRRQA